MVRSVEGMNETTKQSSTSVTTAGLGRADASGAGRRRLFRAATVALAIVLPLLVWAIAVPLAGLELVEGSGPTAQAVGPASIVSAVLVAGLAAWGVLALLERFTARSGRTFAIVGWTVLALSLLGRGRPRCGTWSSGWSSRSCPRRYEPRRPLGRVECHRFDGTDVLAPSGRETRVREPRATPSRGAALRGSAP